MVDHSMAHFQGKCWKMKTAAIYAKEDNNNSSRGLWQPIYLTTKVAGLTVPPMLCQR